MLTGAATAPPYSTRSPVVIERALAPVFELIREATRSLLVVARFPKSGIPLVVFVLERGKFRVAPGVLAKPVELASASSGTVASLSIGVHRHAEPRFLEESLRGRVSTFRAIGPNRSRVENCQRFICSRASRAPTAGAGVALPKVARGQELHPAHAQPRAGRSMRPGSMHACKAARPLLVPTT